MVALADCTSGLGCVGCPTLNGCRKGLGSLGLFIPGIAKAASAVTQPQGLPAVSTPATGPSWWESVMSTVGDVAKYGSEIAKVAVPGYLSLKQMQEQTKALRLQMRRTGSVDPQLLQQAGQTLSVIPGVGQELQTMQNELLRLQLANEAAKRGVANPFTSWPTTYGLPGVPAGEPKKEAEPSTLQKALPWVAGAAAVGLVVLVLVMKK